MNKNHTTGKKHPYVAGQKNKLTSGQDDAADFLHHKAQTLLLNGETSSRYREEFFDEIFIDLLNDLFSAWLHSAPEEMKKREYLYQSALSLGSVKAWLLKAEQIGRNVSLMLDGQIPNQQPDNADEEEQS